MKKWLYPGASRRMAWIGALLGLLALFSVGPATANNAWNGYHWARTSNPFTLKVENDTTNSTWNAVLGTAATDWTASSVLNLTQVNQRKGCQAYYGIDVACNRNAGPTGWLGLGEIWADANHIVAGRATMNDYYFKRAPYNTSAWRKLVMCQEVGHTLGLDHQDEVFDNPNLGTCMDYTSNPAGPPSNEHPNAHDYDELETIYAHLDSTTTIAAATSGAGAPNSHAADEAWGSPAGKKDGKGRDILFVKDLGAGQKKFTWVFWAD